jgi:16S rRNA (guanine527-N7)-methyltransferase
LNAEALDAICGPLALAPSETQRGALTGFLQLLQRWSATYNLTAVREPAAMLTQHLADCLAVIEPLRRKREHGRLLDVGSGGGLPGVVIAIMLPRVDVTCVDAVGKKSAFVRQAAGVLRLPNLHAVHARVERMNDQPFDVIASRAFASLLDFTASTRAQLAENGIWMAMKGRKPDDEISALPDDVDVFHVEPLTVPGLDAQRCLVWMRRSPER